MLVEGLPKNDLDSFRGHLLIGSNFLSLLKLLIWDTSENCGFVYQAKNNNKLFYFQGCILGIILNTYENYDFDMNIGDSGARSNKKNYFYF